MGCLVSTQSSTDAKSKRRKKKKLTQAVEDTTPVVPPSNVDVPDALEPVSLNVSATKENPPGDASHHTRRHTAGKHHHGGRPNQQRSSSSSSDSNARVRHPLIPPSHVDDTFEKPKDQQQSASVLALPPTTVTTSYDGLLPIVSVINGGSATQDPRKYSLASSAHLRSNSLVPVDRMPHDAGKSDDGPGEGMRPRQFVDDDGDESERDPASTATSELLFDSDLEDFVLSDELQAQMRSLPEALFEIQPISHLVTLVFCGTVRLDKPEEEIMPSLRTKMRYRDVDGWLSEIGHLPAPVQALVHAGAERGAGPLSPKLNLKLLEQNERLLLQLKSRTTPSTALATRDAYRSSAHMRGGLTETAPLGNEDLAESFEEQRRGSRTSGGRFRYASAAKDVCAGVADFYQELETEERRLSTLKSSSDEEFD